MKFKRNRMDGICSPTPLSLDNIGLHHLNSFDFNIPLLGVTFSMQIRGLERNLGARDELLI